MSTKTLINRIVARAGTGWNRSGSSGRSILKLVEQGQDELFEAISERLIWRGTDNQGFPPYLYTTVDVYDYEIKAANLSCGALSKTINGTVYACLADKVIRVYVDITSLDYDYNFRWIGEPILYAELNPYTTQTTRLIIRQIYVEATHRIDENTNPRVMFVDNPGTTTAKYFIDFTWKPTRLTSEGVPLFVPTRFESALEDYAVGKIQEAENGGESPLITRFYNFWMTEYKKTMNQGARSHNSQVIPRLC